ncbi:MAG: AtpZ/AtpI family protein [Verrucomicrobia bacterium]|nr:AtpZ/AtpI family protein [Verrucomicrobiota bacterium]MCH8512003.1 AtpZ/AtpI family protein [Kiritimatiellia bacterium]
MPKDSSDPKPLLNARRDPPDGNRTHPGVLFGSSFAVAMGLFGWLGHLWDEKTGRAPLGVLLGISVGLIYGAYEVWKLVRRGERPVPTVDSDSLLRKQDTPGNVNDEGATP